MVKYGREILENTLERILNKIQKESWESFSFVKYSLKYTDTNKKVAFYFKKDDWGFQFELYANSSSEDWLEHMVMDIKVYELKYKKEWKWIGDHKKMVSEPIVLKKIYGLVKEEVEKTMHNNPILRMKTLFYDKENMLQTGYDLEEVIRFVESKKKGELL